jgi:hypothetical protein
MAGISYTAICADQDAHREPQSLGNSLRHWQPLGDRYRTPMGSSRLQCRVSCSRFPLFPGFPHEAPSIRMVTTGPGKTHAGSRTLYYTILALGSQKAHCELLYTGINIGSRNSQTFPIHSGPEQVSHAVSFLPSRTVMSSKRITSLADAI